jgi:hypothetical protein
MSLLESKAFDNFVKERVIEILQEDEGYVKINEQISKIESKPLKALNKEQRKEYCELESLRENMIDYLQTAIYRTCVLKRIGVK